MVCQACGNSVAAEVRYCPKCGAQVVAASPVPPPPGPPAYPPVYAMQRPRVQRNLQLLAILWCIFGAYRAISALIAVSVLRIFAMRGFGGHAWMWGSRWHGPFGAHWMGPLLPFVTIVTVVAAVLAFLVGFGLLRRKPWARPLAIVISILVLLKFPLGTALGVYTLWVLAPAASGLEYEAIADHSGI